MKKTSYLGVNLDCITQTPTTTATSVATVTKQPANALDEGQCLTGIISRTETGFRFEEAIRKGRAPRNPKLFDGKFISMVRMLNGRYQLHLKTMEQGFDKKSFALAVYTEICNALKMLD